MCIYSPMPHTLSYSALIGKCALIRSNTVVENRGKKKRKWLCCFTSELQIKGRIMDTLKCLSIGTPKAINFPFVSNEKLKFFRCSSIQAHCNEAVIYLNFGTSKNYEFSIWNKWKIYYF